MTDQNYFTKAKNIIESLVPPTIIKVPQFIMNAEKPKKTNKTINKQFSFNSIKKNPNPVQKNIQVFHHNRIYSPLQQGQYNDSSFKLDSTAKEINQDDNKKQFYLKIPEISNESIFKKKSILSKLESQYQQLKSKLDQSTHRKKTERLRLPPMNNRTPDLMSKEQFEKEIEKKKVCQNGVEYFADLYMIKKNREKAIKSALFDNKTVRPTIKQQNQNIIQKWLQALPEQKQFIQNIKNSGNQNKKKVIQQKGYLSHLYYELVALSPSQKRKIKQNSKFSAASPYKNLL